MITVTPDVGLLQRSWAGGNLVKKRTFSLLQWLWLRYVRIWSFSSSPAHRHPGSSQAFTGAVPFHGKVPAAAMLSIMGGERPPRPSHPQLTSNLWALMQRCWDKNPASRPEVSVVSKIFYGTQVGQAIARTDGAGIPHADLRSAPGRGKKPKKYSNGIGPRELFVREVSSQVAEIKVGLDPNHGPDDDTEGKYWSRGKDTRVASRMLFSVHIFPHSPSNMDGGSVPYLNEAYNPGGTSRNFSSLFFRHIFTLKDDNMSSRRGFTEGSIQRSFLTTRPTQ